MKKLVLKPGFEFIFSLSIMAILCLPMIVLAQNPKDLQITIVNGDTTVNGKNIKDLSPKERQDALSNINNINNIPKADGHGRREIVIERRQKGNDDGHNVIIERAGPDRFKNQMGKDSTFAFDYRMNRDEPSHGMEEREFRFNRQEGGPGMMRNFNRRNTQNFIYTNTDGQGITTRVIYHVSEPSGAVGHIPGESEPSQYELLDIKDLNLIPEFSEGKTVLMFNLPAKAAAEVKLKDSQGNVLWSEKALNGSFSKAFSLGLNGEYYLHVKQGRKIVVKKIVKE